MRTNENENIGSLTSRIAYEIVNEEILSENNINKLLGILSNNGVYAMWIWAKSQKDICEKKLFNKFLNVIKFVGKKEDEENFEDYFQKISQDIHKVLFLKQLLEKTLIYARYHAKALGD